MNKDLIDLQKGCKSTCAVVSSESCDKLENSLSVDSRISYSDLNNFIKTNVVNNNDLDYFIVKGIDEIDSENQEKFTGLVKDRIIFNNKIPDNLIIVLTVESKDSLNKISKELYKFCVIAF